MWQSRSRLGSGLRLLVLLAAFALGACGHKLVADPGQHSVAVYSDASVLEQINELRREGGAAAMLGNLGEKLAAPRLPEGTPVKILRRDPKACEIEVTAGSQAGLRGFVAPANVR